MLIKVFTIWLMTSNITALHDKDNFCRLWFTSNSYVDFREASCDDVANEINNELIRRNRSYE